MNRTQLARARRLGYRFALLLGLCFVSAPALAVEDSEAGVTECDDHAMLIGQMSRRAGYTTADAASFYMVDFLGCLNRLEISDDSFRSAVQGAYCDAYAELSSSDYYAWQSNRAECEVMLAERVAERN